MYELERKARADHRAIRERLRELDLTPQTEVVQTDTYLDHPHRDFAETDEALRVRREHPAGEPDAATVELTYKGPRIADDAKTRVERTTTIGDAESLTAILEELGFVVVAAVAKRRTRFEHDDVTICLDDVDGLGEFVELEAETDADGLEAAHERVEAVSQVLGLDGAETITTPYLTMLLDEPVDRSDESVPGDGSASRSP